MHSVLRGNNRFPFFALVSAVGAGIFINRRLALRAERRHPPTGKFIKVDGVALHYTDRGVGTPIVLIHGNAVDHSDWDISGITGILLERHRVITFDRPGCGHSDRPRRRLWTAPEQADLIYTALQQIGVSNPVVVGHSFGSIVAMALALRHQAAMKSLVVISGYFFWTLRPDVVPPAIASIPLLGDLLRYTVSPLLGWLQMPLQKWAMFSPKPVSAKFNQNYVESMVLRPVQLRASSLDGMTMIPSVIAMEPSYGSLKLPVTIVAGAEDKIVFKRNSQKLYSNVPHSILKIMEGCGHMVHHQRSREIADLIIDAAI